MLQLSMAASLSNDLPTIIVEQFEISRTFTEMLLPATDCSPLSLVSCEKASSSTFFLQTSALAKSRG